jgi:mono/diheme cytochrome c family protein
MARGRVSKRRVKLGGAAGVALCAVGVGVLGGCRGDRSDNPPRQFFPDMDDSPKARPQAPGEFFPDGRAMRPGVPGTVPFGRWEAAPGIEAAAASAGPTWQAMLAAERQELLKDDAPAFTGIGSTGPDGKPQYLRTIPMPVDEALLARGQERYNIYCAACHGLLGRGEGMVGQRWTGRTVANFHDPKYSDPDEPDQKSADGFIFHTAMTGVWDPSGAQKMPPYSHALSERDAWAIVAHIRVLQEQQRGRLADVPEPRRTQLQQELAKMPLPHPAPAPAAAPAPSGQGGQTPPGAGGPAGTPQPQPSHAPQGSQP